VEGGGGPSKGGPPIPIGAPVGRSTRYELPSAERNEF